MSGVGLQSLTAVAQALGVPASRHDVALGEIVTDSRRLTPGSLFVALRGEHFDAHQFIAQARQAGAVAALVEQPVNDPLPQLVVPDTRLALGLLGRARRRAWGGPLVAVTGNSGKTSVKELLAQLLGQKGDTLATRGNLNNDIGAPITLLELREEHRQAIVELGANHLGEIAWITGLAEPQVAIITNVTGAHVGEFGSMGQIAQAKGEILAGLGDTGLAVLNRDDRYFSFWSQLAAPREVLDFGFSPACRVRADELACDARGRYAFTLVVDGRRVGRVQLALLGRHSVANALAATAGALALGVSDEALLSGLATARPVAGRLVAVAGIHGSCLLDDSYNANPGAVKAALEVLAELPGPKWCLLGAMGELGSDTSRLHAEIGHYARELGIDALMTCGEPARAASEAFGDGGYHFNDDEALVQHALNQLPSGASVLIKGSRSAGMERVVMALRADAPR